MSFDKEAIHELYPGAEDLMISPMLIHGSTDKQLRAACDSGEYFGQFKKDGALYMFVVGSGGQCYLFGRTVSKKTGLLTEKLDNVPHIYEALSGFPPNTIILGEIYYPHGSSRNTTEIMGCLADKAVARQQEKGWIHYYIYDILMYNGIDFIKAQTPNWLRYKILAKLYNIYLSDSKDYIELAESWDDNLYERVGKALNAGEEGMVIKKKNGTYEPDKRPMTNLKAKKVDFIDGVIIGFETPTKYYYGKDINNWEYWIVETDLEEWRLPVGCHIDEPEAKAVTKYYYMGWTNSRITIGAYDDEGELVEIGSIHSGISDAMKQDMTLHPNNYYMKVAKIQCMEKDNQNHTVRHGFFIGLHDEKNPEECTITSIFDN